MLLETLHKTRADFISFRDIVSKDIAITATLLDIVQQWFTNVEIVYPIAEMSLSENQQKSLAETIAVDLVDTVSAGIARLEAGDDPDDVMPDLSTSLDNLWRELTGVYATTLNGVFNEAVGILDDDDREFLIENLVRGTAEMNQVDEEDVRNHLRTDATARARLRRMGIDPDSI